MALTSVTVTSNIHDVSTAGIGGTLLYRLSGVDIEHGEGIIVPVLESVPVAADGTSNATLWATDAGEVGRSYTVHFTPPATGAARPEIRLGEFVLLVSDAPSIALRDLLLRSGSVTPLTPELIQQAVDASTAAQAAAAQAVALQSAVQIRTIGGNHTAQLIDAGHLLTFSGAATLTIPAQASVAWPAGTVIAAAQLGAATLTVSGAEGVTITAIAPPATTQGGALSLIRVAPDSWLVLGDLT